MKEFEEWYENIGINMLDDCLFRLPKDLAKETWKAALKWVLKEAISLDERGDISRTIINRELEQ